MSRSLLDTAYAVRQKVDQVVVGKEELKRLLLVGLLARGHVLIEGLPGTGKTITARTFAAAVGGEFRRIQFAPDTLPGDVTGFYLYEPNREPRFVAGPVFGNVILADELNRTTPRTQAALLEAMQEGQVTLDGVTHPLPQPHMVVASQLPYGGPGTYPLTLVQSDRFALRVLSGLPTAEEERAIVTGIDAIELADITPAVTPAEVLELQQAAASTHVEDAVADYLLALIQHVRNNRYTHEPLSPRASIALFRCARCLAFLSRRDYVIPDDIKSLFPAVVHHRVTLTSEAEAADVGPADIVSSALSNVPVPREL